ncbi:signal peptidase I [Dactylosporangium aurantiacum]|uniref:Signal peptidase I n=1 Tax=Dactylosporangium aurantiacum TaxID=35754 RepID=A0A9Q9MF25_9ACTN|nr:signal peptidase I [Dactylosporangium aurantiacum]
MLFTVGVAGLGWKPYVVMSESMSPALHAGDVILVDPNADSLAVYEIVTYSDPRGLVTHRVIAQAEDGTFTVKGDANQRPDTRPVERRQVIGPVRLILPHLGWPVVQVRTHPFKIAGGALILALVWPRRRVLRIVVLGGLVAVVAMVPTTGALPPDPVALPPPVPASPAAPPADSPAAPPATFAVLPPAAFGVPAAASPAGFPAAPLVQARAVTWP